MSSGATMFGIGEQCICQCGLGDVMLTTRHYHRHRYWGERSTACGSHWTVWHTMHSGKDRDWWYSINDARK